MALALLESVDDSNQHDGVPLLEAGASRSLSNARMMWTFICTARGLSKTDDRIATPCSVNA